MWNDEGMGTLHGKERWTIVVIYKADRPCCLHQSECIFFVTGTLWDESTGHWVPLKKASGAGFDVFFDLRMYKRLSEHWIRRCIETPWSSLWRHCNSVSLLYETDSIIKGDIIIKGHSCRITPRPMWDICQLYPYWKVYRIVSGSKTTDDINCTKTMYTKNICILYGVCLLRKSGNWGLW